jgi:hypothetical protein
MQPFVYRPPADDCCSLCGSQVGPFEMDRRPTGPDFQTQAWPVCEACRRDRLSTLEPDPAELARRYLIFWRWLLAEGTAPAWAGHKND